jgi:holo-[acyl-carrier protein] synthase
VSPAAVVGPPGVLVGIDAVDVERFAAALARRPGLGDRLFSSGEQAAAAVRRDRVATLASFFAAKEAVMKALATGLFSFPLRDVEVVEHELGLPELRLGPAATALASARGVTTWRLLMTVEPPVAVAIALAEAAPTT